MNYNYNINNYVSPVGGAGRPVYKRYGSPGAPDSPRAHYEYGIYFVCVCYKVMLPMKRAISITRLGLLCTTNGYYEH